jgi:ferritin
MIGKKLHKTINDQIKNELESAYLYLAMAAYFHREGLDGFAQWMRVQALEEQVHAIKFFDHLRDRSAAIELKPLAILKSDWSSPLQAFQEAYQHEQFITGKINNLVKIADQEHDHTALPMLHWFITEQIEEEASTSKIAQTLERIGKDGGALVMLDRELGARVFTPPPATPELGAGAA